MEKKMVTKFKWAGLATKDELLEFGASDSNTFATFTMRAINSSDMICFEVQMGLNEIQYMNRLLAKKRGKMALEYIKKKCPVIGFPSEHNAEFAARWKGEKVEIKIDN